MKLFNAFAGKGSWGFILVTMFLNFLGFSIIIPILPFLVGEYVHGENAIALAVGILLAVYALCQFIAAPGLGAISDKIGRRPILLFSLLGSVVGYVILGIGGALWLLFLGRIIDGLTGGNISTVFAYVSDITAPKERGKMFGLIGAAGGFGFMIGPALGGFLGTISIATPLFAAAGITLLNVLWGYFVLPESLPHHRRTADFSLRHLNPLAPLQYVFALKPMRLLFVAAFLLFFALNAMYGNASVFMKDVFSWGTEQIGLLLFIVGVVDVFSQGYLVRRLLPLYNEEKLATWGLALMICGFFIAASTAYISSVALLYAGIIILNIGDGLFEPTTNTIISTMVDHSMQGKVQGAYQGIQSVARVLGPLFADWIYAYGRALPYGTEALIAVLALFVLVTALPAVKLHRHTVVQAEPEVFPAA